MVGGKKRIYTITVCAMFIGIIAVCAQICLPIFGVAFTLQTLAVSLCGYMLGFKRSFACVLTYIILGAMGLPIFSAFTGSFGVILGKSGGFIIGFLPLVALCSLAKYKTSNILKFLFGFSGVFICHILGTVWFAFVSGTSLAAAFIAVSLPFILKDLLCVWLSVYLQNKISIQNHKEPR